MGFDVYVECVGDVAESGEAGGSVVVGFIALDLLFGHVEGFGWLALCRWNAFREKRLGDAGLRLRTSTDTRTEWHINNRYR